MLGPLKGQSYSALKCLGEAAKNPHSAGLQQMNKWQIVDKIANRYEVH